MATFTHDSLQPSSLLIPL